MTDFTFILSSTDHRSLDSAVQHAFRSLSNNNTKVFVAVLPSILEKDGKKLVRKLAIESTDVHVVQKIQHIDLPQGVTVKAFA